MFYKTEITSKAGTSIKAEALYANEMHANRLMVQDIMTYDPFFRKQEINISEVDDHLEGMEAYTHAWEEWLHN